MRLLLCCAALAALCACTGASISQPAEVPDVSSPMPIHRFSEQPLRQNLVFLVEDGNDLFGEAAELFAKKVEDYSGGYLTVEMRKTENPTEDFLEKHGDFAFVDSRADGEFSELLTTLALPMLYKDYDTFTMALNSAAVLEVLAADLQRRNAVPLAAFYGGGNFLATLYPRSSGGIDLDSVDGEAFSASGSAGIPLAALRDDSQIGQLLRKRSFELIEGWTAIERLQGINGGTVPLVDFSLEELETVLFERSGVTVLHVGHNLSPEWLIVRADRYQAMPSHYQAAIQEAVTHLFPVLDGSVQKREAELVERLRQNSISVERSFSALQELADEAIQEERNGSYQKKYLLDLIFGME